ncbi:DUF3048 domain-containing protein [Candidatus Gottesmanbacteria bacterium]|nr:DUF3048 domain-containing protein [Candidatus Gottesmanbacteria bacterium]
MKKKQHMITTGFIGLALFLIATGVSFALFSYLGRIPGLSSLSPLGPQDHFVVDPSLPKTEPCPINGALFSKPEKELWAKRRPLAVMIENHAEARPQSGLSDADVVYEAVAEGGITRFMGIFYCGAAEPVTIAPVRSARTYFLPWVLEYDALYNHVGGAGRCYDTTVDERAKALCQIEEWGIKDMDQFGISFPTCYRNYDRLDHPVATEHTMVCFTDKLWKLAAERGLTNVDSKGVAWDTSFQPWTFKDDPPAGGRGASSSASFVAWKGYEREYGVRWDYDPNVNMYKRSSGGVPQADLENQQQLSAKVVVILFVREIGPVDNHAHLLYNNVGSGDGQIWQDGKVTKITWKKPQRTSRTKFYDTKSAEVQLNRGQIWIEMLPIGTSITVN